MSKSDSNSTGRTRRGTFAEGHSGNPGGRKPSSYRVDESKLPGSPKMLGPQARMLPKGTRTPRMDDWRNALTGQGQVGRDKRQGGYFAPIALTFDQLALIWQGDDLAARSVETIPKEANRAGWDLTITDTEDDSSVDTAEMSSEVKDLLTELGCDDALEQAGKFENAYGGGVVLIGANDKQTDLSQPLNLDAVVSLDYLTPLEARACIPRYAYGDPTKPDYGKVETYQLTSRSVLPSRTYSANSCIEVHESRLLVFPGIKVSQYQPLTARSGWGEAQLARTFRVLRDFNAAWAGASVLASEFGQKVYKMAELWACLATDDGKAFQDRLEAMDLGASTMNATVIDASDDVVRQTTGITGLGDLLDKFAVRLAAACDMPLTLLFGTSPAGMNATGESDIRFFYDRVDAYRQSKLAPNLRRLIKIAYRACGYKIEPKKWSVRFLPLWQESVKDTAAAMLTQAQADVAWITASVLSPEEVAKAHWGKGEYNPHLSIDFAAREAGDQAAAGPVTIADLDAMAAPNEVPDPEVPPAKPSKDRLDDFSPDQPRDPDGKFGSGGSADREAKSWSNLAEKSSAVAKAEGKVAKHAERLAGAKVNLATAKGEAQNASRLARSASARATRSPTPENQAAAKAAKDKHTAAKTAVETHKVNVAARTEKHANAQTKVAIAHAGLREAQRASTPNQPIAKPVELHAQGIGFERIHGEHETGATPLDETPDFHFGASMGQIAGEHEHPVHEPASTHATPAAAKETTLEMLSRTRPNYVHQPAAPRAQPSESDRRAKEIAETTRQRAQYEAARPVSGAWELKPAVQTVSLPEVHTIAPRPGVLARAGKAVKSLFDEADTDVESE